MQIIIQQAGVKRAIEGAFQVCLSRQDAKHLRKQLLKADNEEHHYGWITIEPPADVVMLPNTPPRPWVDV